MIAYLTDVEGRWDKFASFLTDNPHVSLADDRLRLADGVTFVFGGDAIDRGPAGRKIVALLLRAKRDYGDRVILLAGNRDINKLRLPRELAGEPPHGAPDTHRVDLLKWIFINTMGAPKAFDHRATELGTGDGDAVVQSFLDDLAPGGPLRAYLHACQLGFRAGATLFLHGGVTSENFGTVPGQARTTTVDAWIAAMNRFYAGELDLAHPDELIAYQAPHPGTHMNQDSVVYARPTDEVGNPHLPDADVIARLRADGITRVVVGHTPSGDCPSVVRDGDFELLLADNSYGRIELGSQVALDDDTLHIRGAAELDDGTHVVVQFRHARRDDSPLGRRDADTGQLVKAPLDGGAYLMFKGLEARRIQQVRAEDLARRTLVTAR